MTLKAKAYLPADGIEPYSDIESVQYQDGALVVVLACKLNENRNIEGVRIAFPSATGFRLLDELDLARYWLSKEFTRGSYLLEVADGGWAAEETELQGYERPRREWLALTGNACVNVFCDTEPQVCEVSWPFEDA
jgi:hypothetical protein